jgi:uncharacterized membrane protein
MQLSPSTNTWVVVALAFLLQVSPATAWPTIPVHHLPQMQLTRFPHSHQFSRGLDKQRFLSKRPLKNSEMDEAVDDDSLPGSKKGVFEKRKIEISSQIDLPFSPEVAYDAYSDLTRQSSWSYWLHSVEYLGNDREQSKWTMKFMGLKYSWTAIATKNERPHTIQWESTSGLRNFGTVHFEQQPSTSNDDGGITTPNTQMKMQMTFVAPRAVSLLFRRSKRLASFVQAKMITASMLEFRQVVLEVDLNRSTPREKEPIQ